MVVSFGEDEGVVGARENGDRFEDSEEDVLMRREERSSQWVDSRRSRAGREELTQ